jgi:hypothetical protein
MPQGLLMLYQKLVSIANSTGWTVNLVDDSNIGTYIENSEEFENVFRNNYYPQIPQIKSDLIRHALIYYNGGVWIDVSSIILESFDWIHNIENQTHVYNKYQHKDPDVILFFSEDHQINKKYTIGLDDFIMMPGY